MSHGQLFSRKKFWNCQIRENTFLDGDIGPNENYLLQSVWI